MIESKFPTKSPKSPLKIIFTSLIVPLLALVLFGVYLNNVSMHTTGKPLNLFPNSLSSTVETPLVAIKLDKKIDPTKKNPYVVIPGTFKNNTELGMMYFTIYLDAFDKNNKNIGNCGKLVQDSVPSGETIKFKAFCPEYKFDRATKFEVREVIYGGNNVPFEIEK